jgi:hypothetical protein
MIIVLKRSASSPSLLETESNHSSEKDLQSPAFPEANKLLHDSDSNLHKIIQDGSNFERNKEDKMARWNVASKRPDSLISKSTDILGSTSKPRTNSVDFSLSPESSESSVHDELTELPSVRKARGHTISLVPPDRSHDDSRLTTARDTGRGGINPSFVFLQLYFGGMLNSGQELPILLPQSDVSFTNQRIIPLDFSPVWY